MAMNFRLLVLTLLAVAVAVAVNLYPLVENLPYHAGVVLATSTGALVFFVALWLGYRADLVE